ncbi:methyltransferase domain-containing protein [Thioalkalivibrio thiocyanodenitrificans]|uniref:methyltransferase domain-containing protein n=1 Tax=Thioalkalivibrio thiocyanodenitrificans TaxID=243063 RepID=UPI0003689DB5|nr:class I SAM-dependent methyltransferase [Thioalkalivibrio thiocyanodenitrificans]
MLELDGAPPAGVKFFHRELAEFARLPEARILISGGADSGLLALVAEAFSDTASNPTLIFVDQCATPCHVNAAYARETGIELQILQGDIREARTAPVDAIVAHSFLPFFQGRDRQLVLSAWARLLRPGGKLLMSTWVTESETQWAAPKDANTMLNRANQLKSKAARLGWDEHTAAELAETAQRFWAATLAKPPAITRDYLHKALSEAGFAMEGYTAESAESIGGPYLHGQATHAARHRAEVVARRV